MPRFASPIDDQFSLFVLTTTNCARELSIPCFNPYQDAGVEFGGVREPPPLDNATPLPEYKVSYPYMLNPTHYSRTEQNVKTPISKVKSRCLPRCCRRPPPLARLPPRPSEPFLPPTPRWWPLFAPAISRVAALESGEMPLSCAPMQSTACARRKTHWLVLWIHILL